MCFLSRLLRMGRHVAVILHLAFVASCLLNIPNLPDIIVIFLLGWAGSWPMSFTPYFQQHMARQILEKKTVHHETFH